jgi:SAM-dependent methyltransferase
MEHPPRTRAFDVAYEGTPSWETGRPQPALLRLLDAGAIRGRVLDAGCGTGRHAILLAGRGHDVTGVDFAAAAIEEARVSARELGSQVRFVVADALELGRLCEALGGPFDTALDIGLFHVLQPDERRPYARALASVLRPGASAFVIAWSDRNPFGVGPSRVGRRMLRDAFRAADGWRIEAIEPEILETRLAGGPVQAWLARLRRR